MCHMTSSSVAPSRADEIREANHRLDQATKIVTGEQPSPSPQPVDPFDGLDRDLVGWD